MLAGLRQKPRGMFRSASRTIAAAAFDAVAIAGIAVAHGASTLRDSAAAHAVAAIGRALAAVPFAAAALLFAAHAFELRLWAFRSILSITHLGHSLISGFDEHGMQQVSMTTQRQALKGGPKICERRFQVRQQSSATTGKVREGVQGIELPTALILCPVVPSVLAINEETEAFTELMQSGFRQGGLRDRCEVGDDLAIGGTRWAGAVMEVGPDAFG